ncbi:hypothetical protein [Idiomarina sp. ST20R2A10]|uniref:hypothetical protein n=1 Tax=Idiomarina sp. ST20R2A10 TaxID=3418369 RepID=UPI003F6E22D7
MAIIIAYNPDNEKLKKILIELNAQGCEKIIVYKNSKINYSIISECQFCDFIGEEENIGLGKAINFSFQYLKTSYDGVEFSAFTFDQDTEIPKDFVCTMIKYKEELVAEKACVSAVVPRIFDSRSDDYEYKLRERPSSGKHKLLAVGLQSGMLIDYRTWFKHQFNEELFIEFVDTEWCHRTANNGKYLHLCSSAYILHEVSDEKPKEILGMKLLKYSPVRRYYFYRNSIFMLRSKDVPLISKYLIFRGAVNRMLSILLLEESKKASFKMSIRGLFDGLKSRFGKISGL